MKPKVTDGAFYYCPYMPLDIGTPAVTKITFTFKDIGEQRWLGFANVPRSMTREFESWMKEFAPTVWLNKAMWDLNPNQYEKPGQIYELRSGDPSDRTMLLLKWGN